MDFLRANSSPMRKDRGMVIFSIAVFVSLIGGLLVSVLLYLLSSYGRLNASELRSERLKFVYESAKARAWYEIVTNPNLQVLVANGQDYVINGFVAEGIPVDIVIGPDKNQDGFFDVIILFNNNSSTSAP